MWKSYYQPETLDTALALAAASPGARFVAGGTDLLVELGRGVGQTDTLIDLSRVAPLRYVRAGNGVILLGALATHNDVIAAPDCVAGALPLAQASLEVGAPQIRTRGTVAGNLVTASPANDTITALTALGAELVLARVGGERVVPIEGFYTGVRRTVLRPGELVREIRVPALGGARRGIFLKLGLRRAQAIAVINVAAVLALADEGQGAPVVEARIALGCVAPTIVRAADAERSLVGKGLDEASIAEAAALALAACAPIDDVRGSAAYRREAVVALVTRALARLAEGSEAAGWPAQPVLLEDGPARNMIGGAFTTIRPDSTSSQGYSTSSPPDSTSSPSEFITIKSNSTTITPDSTSSPSEFITIKSNSTTITPNSTSSPPDSTTITPNSTSSPPDSTTIEPGIDAVGAMVNGCEAMLSPRKTLLDALREDAGLTGTKEGCAEGECGACTVWLDGQAVMSCLVPAAQANGRVITTIEGLAATGAAGSHEGTLHPLQASFIAEGAVQCGYCIPGMLMAGAKLLAEHPRPALDQIQAALSGNICRCTGYSKIIAAVRAAAEGEP